MIKELGKPIVIKTESAHRFYIIGDVYPRTHEYRRMVAIFCLRFAMQQNGEWVWSLHQRWLDVWKPYGNSRNKHSTFQAALDEVLKAIGR